MGERLGLFFDRQVLLALAFILAIDIVRLLLLNAGVVLPDVPLLLRVAIEVSAAYGLAALVWWGVDRWQGKPKA